MTVPVVPSAHGSGARAVPVPEPTPCDHLPISAWIVDGTVPGDPGPVAGSAGIPVPDPRIGELRWIEHRLFEMVGGWVGDEPCPPARVLLSVLARQHGDHAALLAERLPVRAGADPDALTVPAPGWPGMLAHLAVGPNAAGEPIDPVGASGADGGIDAGTAGEKGGHAGGILTVTAARLVGLGRVVLPRLATAYARTLRGVAAADAPVVRALRMVHTDTRDAWGAVEAMVEQHLGAVGAAAAAAAWQGHLEGMVTVTRLR
ncbi:MAG: hypothetical protein M0Z63_06400 [Actinomycetota bacterium]|nr:hypothetical protein [Actinomycetota bacterium]